MDIRLLSEFQPPDRNTKNDVLDCGATLRPCLGAVPARYLAHYHSCAIFSREVVALRDDGVLQRGCSWWG